MFLAVSTAVSTALVVAGSFRKRGGRIADIVRRVRERLVVLDIVLDVDDRQVAAVVGVGERTHQDQQLAVGHFARLHELDRAVLARRTTVAAARIAAERVVAAAAIQQLHVGAVRVAAIEMNAAVAVGMIPAAPHHAAVGQHGGIDIVALVVADLVHAAAVGVHHVQHEGRFVQILGLSLEFRFALVDQHRAGAELARGGKQDSSVRQIVRRDVLRSGAGLVGGRQDGVQRVGRDDVFPDVPVRRIAVFLLRRQRAAHREDDPGAVARHVDILEVIERALGSLAGHARGDVDLGAAGAGRDSADTDRPAGRKRGAAAGRPAWSARYA